MKFERLLQVYWSKGFLFGGEVFEFELSVINLFAELRGVSNFVKTNLIKRLEYSPLLIKRNLQFFQVSNNIKRITNIYFSQLVSVNNPINDNIKYNLLRLYLIRSFRGRCLALGKPARGQRTWSNASNAKNINSVLRSFISVEVKIKKKSLKPEIKNFKLLKKKYAKKKKKRVIVKRDRGQERELKQEWQEDEWF